MSNLRQPVQITGISDYQAWILRKLENEPSQTLLNITRCEKYSTWVSCKRLTRAQQERHNRIFSHCNSLKESPMLSNKIVPAAHRTASGKTVSIACMTDDHLFNTIKLFLEPLTELTKRIEDSMKPMSPRAQALYGGDRKLIIDNYAEVVSKTYKKVGPYVLEATLRGHEVSDRVQPLLRAAFGRSTQDLEGPSLDEIAGPADLLEEGQETDLYA